MSRAEILAFNAGVEAVLALAVSAARALELRLAQKPTRLNFAIGALTALADDGRALLLPETPPAADSAPMPSPNPAPQPQFGEMAVAS